MSDVFERIKRLSRTKVKAREKKKKRPMDAERKKKAKLAKKWRQRHKSKIKSYRRRYKPRAGSRNESIEDVTYDDVIDALNEGMPIEDALALVTGDELDEDELDDVVDNLDDDGSDTEVYEAAEALISSDMDAEEINESVEHLDEDECSDLLEAIDAIAEWADEIDNPEDMVEAISLLSDTDLLELVEEMDDESIDALDEMFEEMGLYDDSEDLPEASRSRAYTKKKRGRVGRAMTAVRAGAGKAKTAAKSLGRKTGGAIKKAAKAVGRKVAGAAKRVGGAIKRTAGKVRNRAKGAYTKARLKRKRTPAAQRRPAMPH